jgi:hypothetical protein
MSGHLSVELALQRILEIDDLYEMGPCDPCGESWTIFGILARKRACSQVRSSLMQSAAEDSCTLMSGDGPPYLDLWLRSFRPGDCSSHSSSARDIRFYMHSTPKRGSGQARTVHECAQILPCESPATRDTPEEETQAESIRRRGSFRPSPEGPVDSLLLIVL